MRYITMILCCGLIYACGHKQKKHELTQVEKWMIEGLKESIARLDTSTRPLNEIEIIRRFDQHIIDSLEHQ